jgi:plasmid stabilization system protein ParE
MTRFLLAPQAKSGLQDIADAFEERDGCDRATHVFRTIMEPVVRVAEHAETGQRRDDLTDLDLRFKTVF